MSTGKSGTVKLVSNGKILESYSYRQQNRRYKAFDNWNKKYRRHLNGMYLIISPDPMKHLECLEDNQMSIKRFIRNERDLIRKKQLADAKRASVKLHN